MAEAEPGTTVGSLRCRLHVEPLCAPTPVRSYLCALLPLCAPTPVVRSYVRVVLRLCGTGGRALPFPPSPPPLRKACLRVRPSNPRVHAVWSWIQGIMYVHTPALVRYFAAPGFPLHFIWGLYPLPRKYCMTSHCPFNITKPGKHSSPKCLAPRSRGGNTSSVTSFSSAPLPSSAVVEVDWRVVLLPLARCKPLQWACCPCSAAGL